MNKKVLIAGIAAVIALIGVAWYWGNREAFQGGRETLAIPSGEQRQGAVPTRENCLADDCLAVQDLEYPVSKLPDKAKSALDEAIGDEYHAQAVYAAVLAKYGNVRPFSMIIRAEEKHISALKAIYDKYGEAIPPNNYSTNVSAGASLKVSCQDGVEAETNNVLLYKNKLIPVVSKYPDISTVFSNLMSASANRHLAAFERCAQMF